MFICALLAPCFDSFLEVQDSAIKANEVCLFFVHSALLAVRLRGLRLYHINSQKERTCRHEIVTQWTSCPVAGLVDSIRRMLVRLTATQFIRVMATGRTAPLLCGCADKNGKYAGEFVAKFLSARGALFEFVGSRLARHFGILVPEPAAVEVSQEFAKLISERLKPRKVDPGLKFGSKVVHPMVTWLVDRTIPDAMFRDAANIFAFDALIQNPDRRVDNPNLFTKGDDIYVYDHEETCFSFLMALSPSRESWNLERETYLENHVFFSKLKRKQIDLADFREMLKLLTREALAKIRDDAPSEWAHDDLKGIEVHLLQVQRNAEKFVEHVQRRLS